LSVRRDIRRFIEDELLGDRVEVDPLAEGLLDSLGMEQLIGFLEERFDIAFEDEELAAEGFASLSAVTELVQQKLRVRM
jgi:acyl carrier protein